MAKNEKDLDKARFDLLMMRLDVIEYAVLYMNNNLSTKQQCDYNKEKILNLYKEIDKQNSTIKELEKE